MDHLVTLDGFADPIKDLAESRTAWVESVKSLDKEAQPEQAITFLGDKHATDSPGGGDRDADLRQAVETVRTEVQQLAKELRSAFVGIVAGGDTALATKQVIESSAVYKVGAHHRQTTWGRTWGGAMPACKKRRLVSGRCVNLSVLVSVVCEGVNLSVAGGTPPPEAVFGEQLEIFTDGRWACWGGPSEVSPHQP